VDIEERRHRNRARMMLNSAAPMTGGVHEFQSDHHQLVAAESKKAREAAAAELQAKEAEAAELRVTLLSNNAKLAEAQKQLAESARSRTLGPWPPSCSRNLVWRHDCDLHRSRRDLGPQVITPVAGRHRFTSA